MSKTPVSTLKKQRGGRPFKPGQSGNPKGRTPGKKNRLTVLAENLVNDEAAAVMRVVVKAAKRGSLVAARLVLERALPPRRGYPVKFDIPRIETTTDLIASMDALIRSTAEGRLTPDEAGIVAGLFEAKHRMIETAALKARLDAIEALLPAPASATA